MEKKQAIEVFQKKFLGEVDAALTDALIPACTLVGKEKKDILFYEGDEGEQVFFLLEGSVRLFRTTDQGKETVVHFVHAGELFAEILLARETRYPVSAMALEPCMLLGMSARRLRQIIQGNPDFALRYIGALTKRLKYLVNMVEHLSSRDVQERFLLYLGHLSASQRLKTVQLPVPKGELALLLGTTPETFSRLLKKLVEEGAIAVDGREITLLQKMPLAGG
ncbi:cyclic nucleotide-binding protein [Desulfurispirillum indicum S5]|uniref:Cyclic nucleotide-binding protein n=1 Tax=Desulfurispirillum indicum (strain ATCC BAA-1389 / DSM 22839 / S5) TaxID=653733 RepID=E6W0M2_DESIS|nr:Crp/Fnr family transcriptional regulator [Desulfurispirillum indicum]ADU65274.1 cyclic nucleotide-binding protein [Desulfurispirillum indicum S5]